MIGAILLTVLASFLLCVRIYFGLQDPPEVAAIRGLHRRFDLPATHDSWLLFEEWPTAIYYGIRGVSANDVTGVDLGSRATDELVAYIAQHFPNVEWLDFRFGAVTSEGLMPLKNCPKLQLLVLSGTLIDDGVTELLPHLPKLGSLHVDGTKITDDFVAIASRHESLGYCNVELTDVTPTAVAACMAVKPQSFRIRTDGREYALTAVICWADGEVTRRFAGHWEIVLYGPHAPEEHDPWPEIHRNLADPRLELLTAGLLAWWPKDFQNQPDGRYQFRLKLGDYESEPVEFTIADGKPSIERVKFRMPVTRAMAEKH